MRTELNLHNQQSIIYGVNSRHQTSYRKTKIFPSDSKYYNVVTSEIKIFSTFGLSYMYRC